MKQMRRSPAALLLALLLVLTLVGGIAVTAHARACSHTFSERDVDEYLQDNSTQHKHRIVTIKTCTKCGYVVEINGDWHDEGHNFIMTDGGHYKNNQHMYHETCNNCDYLKRTAIYPCDGPPCTLPFRFQPVYELQ